MSNYSLKILKSDFIAHNVKRFIVEKPDGYQFVSGQGTDVALDEEGWNKQFRPFSFTSCNDWPYLEFTVKIYDDRNGVTAQLGRTNGGASLIIGEPYGMITYKKPGVFIAGGSGITPFLSIFRDLSRNLSLLNQNKLIYSNRTSDDVICREELSAMLGDNYIEVFTHNRVIGFLEQRIDRNYLIEHIADFGQQFYICGPDSFVKHITKLLVELGAKSDALTF